MFAQNLVSPVVMQEGLGSSLLPGQLWVCSQVNGHQVDLVPQGDMSFLNLFFPLSQFRLATVPMS